MCVCKYICIYIYIYIYILATTNSLKIPPASLIQLPAVFSIYRRMAETTLSSQEEGPAHVGSEVAEPLRGKPCEAGGDTDTPCQAKSVESCLMCGINLCQEHLDNHQHEKKENGEAEKDPNQSGRKRSAAESAENQPKPTKQK